MLRLSQTTGYAIQALGCINGLPSPARQIAIIAKCSGVPRPYLSKIIADLSQKGFIATKRGRGGGLSLMRRAEEISLLEIIEAVEGKNWMGDCLLGFENCVHHMVCPNQTFWQEMRQEIFEKLRATTLADLISNRALSESQLPVRSSTARKLPAVKAASLPPSHMPHPSASLHRTDNRASA